MATLRDVAELANVSVTTASRVLNGTDQTHPVSPTMRAGVVAAAAALGYRRSAAARALKHGRSDIIGVIVSDILDPYFAEMTRGAEIAAAASGYVTVVANASRDPQQERRKFQVLREHGASGIIFCGSDIVGSPGTAELAREVTRAAQEGTKVVALAPRGFSSTQIVVDNEATSYRLARYLIDLGHRDITFAGGIPGLAAAEMRIAGYQRAMYEAGLLPQIVGQSGMSQQTGSDAVHHLLSAARRPSAIICTNDEIAVGALAALWRGGIRVPEDISVAGIGGTETGRVFDLTTMVLPLAELGAIAAGFVTGDDARAPSAPPYHLREGGTTRAV